MKSWIGGIIVALLLAICVPSAHNRGMVLEGGTLIDGTGRRAGRRRGGGRRGQRASQRSARRGQVAGSAERQRHSVSTAGRSFPA